MSNEQREQEIRERWRKATAIPWGMVSFTESGFQSPLDQGLIDISIWSASREAYDALYVVPEDIQYLLDEVTYLRGQLSDLCEDSRAAAEVVRLRGVLADLVGGCGSGSCRVRRPTGQHNNGPCRCLGRLALLADEVTPGEGGGE